MFRLRPAVVLAALCLVPALAGGGQAAVSKVGFGPPVFVDQHLAGGEPLVLADPAHGTLVYTSHEGTTHLFREGFLSVWSDFDFASNYCNQVNVWTSKDNGTNWFRTRYLGSPCPVDPTKNTGFSDPDLTMDAGGRIYNTGIDLANDALFSSADGGVTWDQGTPNCHDGDRPWLAGGNRDEVFLSTDTVEDGFNRRVFRSTDAGQTCSLDGIPDFGHDAARSLDYTGLGKLYFDRAKQRLAEPTVYADSSGAIVGLGVSTWQRGDAAFTPHFVASVPEGVWGFFPTIAIDRADTIYAIWTPKPTQAGTSGGCDGAQTPAANSVMLSSSTDFGQTWSAPRAVYKTSNSIAFWPWAVAGDAGKVSVVWYETEPGELADLDCQQAHVHVKELHVTSGRPGTVVDAAGRAVHVGTVCQGGTTCVVTGKDRRLGDYFSNALDARGCVIIATGDTTLTDPTTGGPLLTSRPLFIRQTSGPALVGKASCGP